MSTIEEIAPSAEDPGVAAPTKKDFMSDQVIRWCPGCGDYSILSQVQTVFAELGERRENLAIVSGIGCSSRFPYYMNTYGFHTIHGRATAVATGLKATRPELSVWVVTGDGDGLSIGGNHLLHLVRRNVDVQVLMFNNRIYGLTKGQYSPTSEVGKRTSSTPLGSLDHPFNPLSLILGGGGTFLARGVDTHVKELREVLKAAHGHRGTSFLEIYQNCNIFNDGAFDAITDRKVKDERTIQLVHGEPMVFAGGRKGLRMGAGFAVEVVELGAGVTEADLLVHDKHNRNLAMILARLDYPDFPVPMGVLYEEARVPYDVAFNDQLERARAARPDASLHKLFHDAETWVVK